MTVNEVIAMLQEQVAAGNGDIQLETAPVTSLDRYEITEVTAYWPNPEEMILLL